MKMILALFVQLVVVSTMRLSSCPTPGLCAASLLSSPSVYMPCVFVSAVPPLPLHMQPLLRSRFFYLKIKEVRARFLPPFFFLFSCLRRVSTGSLSSQSGVILVSPRR